MATKLAPAAKKLGLEGEAPRLHPPRRSRAARYLTCDAGCRATTEAAIAVCDVVGSAAVGAAMDEIEVDGMEVPSLLLTPEGCSCPRLI